MLVWEQGYSCWSGNETIHAGLGTGQMPTDLNLYLRGLLAHSGAGSPPHQDWNEDTCNRTETILCNSY